MTILGTSSVERQDFGGDFGAELTLKEASGDKPYFLKFGASVNDIGAIKYNDIRKLSIRGAGSAIDPAKIDIFDLNATADYLEREVTILL